MENNNTHALSNPNARQAMTIETFRTTLAKSYHKQITNYLGGDDKKSLKFMSAAIYVVQKNPKLLECQPETLIQSLMSCAEFELYPSNVAGEAFIIPYKGKATFQLGYQGLITLLARAGISVTSQIVRKNDKFEYVEGLEPKLVHSFPAFASLEERGDWVGVYSILTNQSGQKIPCVMSREQVMGIKNLSQAKDSEYSPWNSKQDPELWMPRKTCIKQNCKLVPKTEVLQKAIAKDNEESVIDARKANIDSAGPATGAAIHKPQEDDVRIVPDPEEELENALKQERKNGEK